MAVARHLSFSKAAKELHVTPAAITHQIHALEHNLGAQLFHRNRRYVTLTRTAETCLPELIQAFEMLRCAVSNARAVTERAVLNVSASPAFASKLLLPRLTEFSELHPDIDIRVTATAQLVDLGDGDTDLAIRFGMGRYKGAHVERLLPEHVVPMCAPQLLAKGNGITVPNDLRHYRLIHDLSVATPEIQPDWGTWLLHAGAKDVDPARGLRFTLADLALQAAINGFGVVLGRKTLARDDIDSGRLLLPLALELPVSFAYFIVIPTNKVKNRPVGQFRDWLMSMATRMESPVGNRPPQARHPGQRRHRR
jgi:LysR family glycine cleavage system transcriptional activator